ncbi:hypothetical protein ES703_112089 [subsurface metagenome]
MKTYLTEQSVEILLSEEEVKTLAEGFVVIGSPTTEFLSSFGKRTVIVRRDETKSKEPRAWMLGKKLGER